MAWVERLVTRTTQPQDACGVDWSNPITRGLVGVVGVKNGTNLPTLSAAPDYAATPSGVAYRWADGGNVRASVPTPSFTGAAYTAITVFTPRATGSGFKKVAGWTAGGTNGGFLFNWDHGNAAYARAVELFGGGVSGVFKFPSVVLGRLTVWAATVSSGNLLGYANGELAGSATTTGTPSGWNTVINGQTGGDPTGSVDGLLTLAFNRAISASEVKSLSDNPWQIFEPEVSRVWIDDATSVSLPTLVQPNATTSAGAWTATGAASLHDAINEVTASAAEYISVNSASTTELVLAEPAHPGTANQTLAYRASSTQGSTLTVTLKQGATQIMTRTHALTGVDTLYTQTLTAPEIALITAGAISVTLTTS